MKRLRRAGAPLADVQAAAVGCTCLSVAERETYVTVSQRSHHMAFSFAFALSFAFSFPLAFPLTFTPFPIPLSPVFIIASVQIFLLVVPPVFMFAALMPAKIVP